MHRYRECQHYLHCAMCVLLYTTAKYPYQRCFRTRQLYRQPGVSWQRTARSGALLGRGALSEPWGELAAALIRDSCKRARNTAKNEGVLERTVAARGAVN
ncbi:hypothetical protein KIL84_023143 [Mauremys mutica]|uniref:Uncharacterized protein n=1 Tax=Mauremys mutica TaxID=74926 RepID=A0A9D4APJ1_9SAUR|nr:hypothetical protein KIL84_023143 [Mauremys mutica]